MSELGINFFIPTEITELDRPAYLAGALCVIHALGKRMEMLNKDGVVSDEADNEIRGQFNLIVKQIEEELPTDIKKKHKKLL